MDGFDANEGVVIMAATNRPEVLDKALLRAGRFDRQIVVPLPTEKGRRQILEIHAAKVSLAPTSTWTGWRASPPASRAPTSPTSSTRPRCWRCVAGRPEVAMADFDLAIERIVAGLQRDTPLDGEVRGRSPTTRAATPWCRSSCPSPTRCTR